MQQAGNSRASCVFTMVLREPVRQPRNTNAVRETMILSKLCAHVAHEGD